MSEFQTIYSVEDVYKFLEIMTVDAHNQRLIRKKADANNH